MLKVPCHGSIMVNYVYASMWAINVYAENTVVPVI